LLKSYALRATLWDLYRTGANLVRREDRASAYTDACKKLSRVWGEELRFYPKAISEPMRYHEEKTLKCLENRELLEHVAPDFLICLTGLGNRPINPMPRG